MATHSSVLAWRIPGTTGEPGGLPSMGLHRVRHNWSDLAPQQQHVLNASLSTGNTAVNKRNLYPLPLWSLHSKLNKKLSRDFLGKRYSYDFRVPLTDNYKEQSIFSQWKDSDGYYLNQIIHTVLCLCLSSWQAFFL